eukprot:COSAG01_NODE_5954_length_3937_cov_7.762376_5_plen_193_part_00
MNNYPDRDSELAEIYLRFRDRLRWMNSVAEQVPAAAVERGAAVPRRLQGEPPEQLQVSLRREQQRLCHTDHCCEKQARLPVVVALQQAGGGAGAARARPAVLFQDCAYLGCGGHKIRCGVAAAGGPDGLQGQVRTDDRRKAQPLLQPNPGQRRVQLGRPLLAVPPSRHKYPGRNSALAEIYLRFWQSGPLNE